MMLTKAGGMILADGLPIKWMGANAYSLFPRLLANGADTTYRTVIDMLSDAGVKVVRMFGDGFDSTKGMGRWETHSAENLTRMELILDYLESKGMGALWCVNWAVSNVPVYKSEAASQLLVGGSPSRTYIKLIVDTVVPAFRDHPALAAWSIGNELQYNLDTLTMAERYTVADNIRAWIAAQDTSGRLIISDFADWNSFALTGQSGGNFDIQATFHNAADAGFETWSTHVYTSRPGAMGTNGSNFGRYIDWLARLAKGNGKPLVVGEFGPDSADGAANELQCQNLAAGWASASNAQLALWWNCDITDYSGNQANVFFNTTEKPYILDLLRQIAVLPYAPQPLDAAPRASLISAGVR